MTEAKTKYRVVTGMNYISATTGKEVRAEPGDVITALLPREVDWLLEAGHIETVGKSSKASETEGVEG